MNSKTRGIYQQFKLTGLSLRPSSLHLLENAELSDIPVIISRIDKNKLVNGVVEAGEIEKAIKSLTQSASELVEGCAVQIISAFEEERIKYNMENHAFFADPKKKTLHGEAIDKTTLMKQRYAIVHQRLSRSNLFSISQMSNEDASNANNGNVVDEFYKLTAVSSLFGCSNTKRIVLGALIQIEQGKYGLEDNEGMVELAFEENMKTTAGVFCEGSIVVVEGCYRDNKFHVNVMGMPPAESRKITLKRHPNINFHGLQVDSKTFKLLEQKEKEEENSFIVMISDLFLDKQIVLNKFDLLLMKYVEYGMIPKVLILMGNFIEKSMNFNENDIKTYQNNFVKLAKIILKYPIFYHNCKIVIVPGPHDPTETHLVPKPKIPAIFSRQFSQLLPSVEFTSNPCRIRYLTQEIVVYRSDLISKIKRSGLDVSSKNDDLDSRLHHHVVKTIIDQSHLSPLPLHIRPVHWCHDWPLHLTPLPDLVVLGDKFDQFVAPTEHGQFINPGVFGIDFSFATYYPSTRVGELCQIDYEEEPLDNQNNNTNVLMNETDNDRIDTNNNNDNEDGDEDDNDDDNNDSDDNGNAEDDNDDNDNEGENEIDSEEEEHNERKKDIDEDKSNKSDIENEESIHNNDEDNEHNDTANNKEDSMDIDKRDDKEDHHNGLIYSMESNMENDNSLDSNNQYSNIVGKVDNPDDLSVNSKENLLNRFGYKN